MYRNIQSDTDNDDDANEIITSYEERITYLESRLRRQVHVVCMSCDVCVVVIVVVVVVVYLIINSLSIRISIML